MQFTYVETESGEGFNVTVLDADTLNKTLTGLEINTEYTVTLCASTSAGCGPIIIVRNSTDEDSEGTPLFVHTNN